MRIATLLVVLFLVLVPRAAHADPKPKPAYQLRLEMDLSLALLGGAVTSGFLVLDEASGVTCATRCDRSKINFLEEGLSNGLNDSVVVVEGALMTSALQVLTSYAVGRPRPRVYGSEAPLEERTDANAARSFFSGHMADTLVVSVGVMQTFMRLGRPTLAWLVLGLGGAGSAFVGATRVLAGSHFPTDVIAGAAIGVGFGLALPALHDTPVRLAPLALPGGGSGLSLVGALP